MHIKFDWQIFFKVLLWWNSHVFFRNRFKILTSVQTLHQRRKALTRAITQRQRSGCKQWFEGKLICPKSWCRGDPIEVHFWEIRLPHFIYEVWPWQDWPFSHLLLVDYIYRLFGQAGGEGSRRGVGKMISIPGKVSKPLNGEVVCKTLYSGIFYPLSPLRYSLLKVSRINQIINGKKKRLLVCFHLLNLRFSFLSFNFY